MSNTQSTSNPIFSGVIWVVIAIIAAIPLAFLFRTYDPIGDLNCEVAAECLAKGDAMFVPVSMESLPAVDVRLDSLRRQLSFYKRACSRDANTAGCQEKATATRQLVDEAINRRNAFKE